MRHDGTLPARADLRETGAAKTDFKKALDSYQARRGVFREVDVPDLRYLMVDGHGDPNTSTEFAAVIETLYPVAYALKFASKARGRDYVVPPLEGLWWAADPPTHPHPARR